VSFLAAVIALGLMQLWGSGGPVQRDAWFRRWCAQVAATGMGSGAALLASVAAPVVLAALVLDGLSSVLFGLPWIAAAAVLLLYAFGRRDLDELMARYRNYCRGGDFQAAWLAIGSELERGPPGEPPAGVHEAHARMQRAFLYEACQRWFAVLLYFLLLGPAGALAYRLLHLAAPGAGESAGRALYYADWLPGRLLAATFTLTGDFVRSREAFAGTLRQASMDTSTALGTVAAAALDTAPDAGLGGEALAAAAERDNAALADLLRRSAVCWVAALCVLVLVG